jgi:UDP:flavonoid glycosyltransferase YjiC (YdhE family)
VKVLFVVTAGVGHLYPMVPLAWALRGAGHEVEVATTGPALLGERAGLSVADVAPGVDALAEVMKLGQAEPEKFAETLRVAFGRVDNLPDVAPFFALGAQIVTEGVVAAADRFRPDVIVNCPMQASGLVAGARLGVPVVSHGFGLARPQGMPAALAAEVPELFEKYAGGEVSLPQAFIDVAPPSLLTGIPAASGSGERWAMRYVPYNGGGVRPGWLDQPRRLPRRLAVTLGTIAPATTGIGPLRQIIELAAQPLHSDTEFVIAARTEDVAELVGELPANVRAESWIPLNALLPQCDGLISHGGSGAVLTALACGIPQLVLPSGTDRDLNAEAVATRGTGLHAGTADGISSDLVETLLRDEQLAAAAREVRAEMAAMPAPAQIAERVVRLATENGAAPVGR